jgi:DNA-binding CsgD family transcriptional regulator
MQERVHDGVSRMRPVDQSSNEGSSPFPAGRPAATRLSVRGLTELVAQLVGVDGHQVIVIAIVTEEGRAPEAGRRMEGRRRVPRAVPHTVAKERQPDDSRWSSLTERERTVARLAGHALTNQQIAHRLRISPHTVNFHMRQVFRKLAIDSRVSLARIVQAHPPVVDSSVRTSPPTDSTRSTQRPEP